MSFFQGMAIDTAPLHHTQATRRRGMAIDTAPLHHTQAIRRRGMAIDTKVYRLKEVDANTAETLLKV